MRKIKISSKNIIFLKNYALPSENFIFSFRFLPIFNELMEVFRRTDVGGNAIENYGSKNKTFFLKYVV